MFKAANAMAILYGAVVSISGILTVMYYGTILGVLAAVVFVATGYPIAKHYVIKMLKKGPWI